MSALPHAALLSILGGEPLGPAQSAQRSAAPPAAVSAPSAGQNGFGEGEAGHEYNHGRRRVQPIYRAHLVQARQGVFSGAGPRSKRHQLALEGKVAARCAVAIYSKSETTGVAVETSRLLKAACCNHCFHSKLRRVRLQPQYLEVAR